MNSFDGGYWLATGAEPCDVVLHDSFNGGVKVKGSAEGCQVWYLSRGPFHELFPVTYCQQRIPETEQNVAEEHLGRILS